MNPFRGLARSLSMIATSRTTVPVRPASRRRRSAVAAVLLACAGAASAGVGTGLLDALAVVRGHQGRADVAYGPLARQRFDVYVPGTSLDAADKATGAPLVIFLYGGSWHTGSRGEYAFAGQALAAQGFVVMVVDYRLSPEVRYPDFLDDCARAVGYGLAHARELGADPRRVFLFGHSAGAYNAAMLALDPRWLRAAGHSPDELAGWVGLAGPYDFLPIGDPDVQRAFDWPATAPDTQPIHHVDDLAQPRPAFIGVARDDSVVRPGKNSVPLAQALRARGAAVTFTSYAHVNHALLVGALAWPLTALAPVLDDTAAFMRGVAPVRPRAVTPLVAP